MNLVQKIKSFFANLFYGLESADKIIQGQDVFDNSKNIGIHQVKDVNRVSPALLKGEVTQEVADLRHRTYAVDESSRYYYVNGTEANKVKDYDFWSSSIYPTKFGMRNNQVCLGIEDAEDEESYTLKIIYSEGIRFKLEKYCEYFTINGSEVALHFNLLPNANQFTSKPFLNYLNKIPNQSTFGGEYNRLQDVSFITYRVADVKNFLKYNFKDLLLTRFDVEDNEIILTYNAQSCLVEDMTKKYLTQDLEKKYKNKEAKHIPQGDIVIELNNKCSICGKIITENEGNFNRSINGKFCCTDCLCKELMEQEQNKVK